jgi:quinol monooxygenase YgiN
MYAVTVTFTIKPGQMESFLRPMRANASESLRQERGCHQFDICLDPSVPDQVFLYELYTDRAAFDVHCTMAHFEAFNATTEDMVAAKSVQCFEEVLQ